MKTTIKLNASSLPWTTCTLHWYRKAILGYSPPAYSANMIYGIAFAKFLDTMFKTKGDLRKAREDSLAAFHVPKIDKDKSPHLSADNHLLVTCMNYWEDVILKEEDHDIVILPDGNPATELSFSFLYYEDEFIQVYLEGTLDKLVKIRNGCYAIGDYKTTSSYKTDTFLDGYETSPQLKFYTLALKLMAETNPDSALGKIGATRIGTFIDGIFLKPKPIENKYLRSDVWFFSDETMRIFRGMLELLITRLSVHVRLNHFYPEGLLNGSCEQKYGKCDYWAVCKTQSTSIAEMMLKRDFVQRVYDPLHHNEQPKTNDTTK